MDKSNLWIRALVGLEYLARLVLKRKVGSTGPRGKKKASNPGIIAIPSLLDLSLGRLVFFLQKPIVSIFG